MSRYDLDKGQATWTDKSGVTHWAVGARMVDSDPGTFLVWTHCGSRDVPAGKALWGGAADCPKCTA